MKDKDGKSGLKIDNCNTSPPFFYSDNVMQSGYSSLLSFTVTDINSTVSKLMALGAELDGPIKYEIHGKVLPPFLYPSLSLFLCLA